MGQQITVLEAPVDRGQPAVGRMPVGRRREVGGGNGGNGCHGCRQHGAGGSRREEMEQPPADSAVGRSEPGTWGDAGGLHPTYWEELQGRMAMLHWLEQGVARLRREQKVAGSEWGRVILRQAVEGTLDVVQETMLEGDELRWLLSRGGGGNGSRRANPGACRLTQLYAMLEEKLRFYVAMEASLSDGDERKSEGA